MKFHRYAQFVAMNIDLAPILYRYVGTPIPQTQRKTQIVEQLEYIAIRPFQNLSLESENTIDLDSNGCGNEICYSLFYHTEDESPCTRCLPVIPREWVDDDTTEVTSLRLGIRRLVFANYLRRKHDKSGYILDSICRVSRWWDTGSGNFKPRITLEIYRVPSSFLENGNGWYIVEATDNLMNGETQSCLKLGPYLTKEEAVRKLNELGVPEQLSVSDVRWYVEERK